MTSKSNTCLSPSEKPVLDTQEPILQTNPLESSLCSSDSSGGPIGSLNSCLELGPMETSNGVSLFSVETSKQEGKKKRYLPYSSPEKRRLRKQKKEKEKALKKLLQDPVPFLPEFRDAVTIQENRSLALQKARWLYVKQWMPITEIAQAIRCRPEQLANVRKEWEKLRDELYLAPIRDFVDSKVEDIKEIGHLSLQAIKRACLFFAGSKEHLSIEDVNKLTQILERLDKLSRLEQGLATDHLKFEQVTNTEDIKKIIRDLQEVDEFVDYGVIDITPKIPEPN